MRSKFLEIEINIKKRLHTIFSVLNVRCILNKSEEGENKKTNVSWTRKKHMHLLTFSGLKKNQLIGLKQHHERYTNTLPVFGFNNGQWGKQNLIESYLIP